MGTKERARVVWDKAGTLLVLILNVVVFAIMVRWLVFAIDNGGTLAILLAVAIVVVGLPLAAFKIWATGYALVKNPNSDEDS